MSNSPRAILFGIAIDRLNLRQAVARTLSWAYETERSSCRFIVTPNVDHVIELRRNPAFRAAYRRAALVIADGMPLVWISRLLRDPLPARIAGPDFLAACLDSAAGGKPLSLFVLGATDAITECAARAIEAHGSSLRVVGRLAPPSGFSAAHPASTAIIETINQVEPDILLIGLGAPKQELWIAHHAAELRARVAFCLGGTVDLLAGRHRRAPGWMGRYGLEWVYRLSREPRRLWRRYVRSLLIFPWLCFREFVMRR